MTLTASESRPLRPRSVAALSLVCALALALLQMVSPSASWAGNYQYTKCSWDWTNCEAVGAFPSAVGVAPDGTYYVGGNFNKVGTAQHPGIAKFTADGVLVDSWAADLSGTGNPENVGSVTKIIATADTVYVSGGFGAGGDHAYLAALNTTDGGFKTDFKLTGPGGIIYDLLLDGSTLYVAGQFSGISYNGSPTGRSNLLAANATTGQPTDWNPSVDAAVNAIAKTNGTVYIGGPFYNIGSDFRFHLGAIDATTGTATAWDPTEGNMGGGSNAQLLVQDMAVSGDGNKVYVGGTFTSIGTTSRNRLAAISTSGTGSVTAWNPNLDYPGQNLNQVAVKRMAVANGYLVVAGRFNQVGGSITRQSAAAFRESDGALLDWTANVGSNNQSTGLDIYRKSATNSTVYVMNDRTTPLSGDATTPLKVEDLYGQINPYAGPSTLPPTAPSVSRTGQTLSWTNPWLGGQNRVYVMYKKHSAANKAASWYIWGYTDSQSSAGLPVTSVSLNRPGCSAPWTCPTTNLGWKTGVAYDFDVFVRSWENRNSTGTLSPRVSYTP